jgi:hypothetical protein
MAKLPGDWQLMGHNHLAGLEGVFSQSQGGSGSPGSADWEIPLGPVKDGVAGLFSLLQSRGAHP